jgi:hypothetical protein
MVRRKATARVQVPIRMTEVLRAQLAKSAKDNTIPLNTEIVRRLEQSFTQDSSTALLEQAKGTLEEVRGLLDYASQSRGDRREG